ncbi:MAG: haloalkane dehalogenase [Planctomycetota bacterium]|nr:MAG: haloalkane dehalogenase [Planctomycetota bacterium]
MTAAPSPHDPHPRKRVDAAGVDMAYVDTGSGRPVVFLHGNPTSSYLWRNVIPHVAPEARCLAPDLVGMGDSGPTPDGSYRFVDHAKYLDAWFEAVVPDGPVTVVGHDWGGALAFHWAARHPDRVAGLAYMETIVCPMTWDDWPEAARGIFQAMRSPAGEAMVLEKNVFVERILPASVLRKLSEEEMDAYRRPFAEAGEKRRPTLTWPREIPLEGEPADVVAVAEAYGRWLLEAPQPKLFFNANPGTILVGRQREFCRRFANQREVEIPGVHFVQEDAAEAIGEAVAAFHRGIAS